LTGEFLPIYGWGMARKIRIEYPGAVYHVMSRGDHQEAIYREEADRELFLRCLAEACEKTGWLVHAFVFMGNHYHLLLETPQANLVVGMKWLQGTYTQRFNSRHKVYGHLFQGRYRALNVDEGEGTHFPVVSTYIHLNPVRARLIRSEGEPLRTYRWSSYPSYLVPPQKRPPWLRVDRVLGSLGIRADDARGRRGYEAYMEGRVLECRADKSRAILEEDWRRIRRGWYLGESSFKDRLLGQIGSLLGQRKAGSVSGEAVRARTEQEAEQWVQKALRRLKLNDAELQALPKGMDAKLVMAWWLRSQTTMSRKWIAQRLGMGHETRVTLAVRAVSTSQRGKLARLRQNLK
jgi:REP element-mobilizing transposase RayT